MRRAPIYSRIIEGLEVGGLSLGKKDEAGVGRNVVEAERNAWTAVIYHMDEFSVVSCLYVCFLYKTAQKRGKQAEDSLPCFP
jgi:hypothetical protein